MHIMQLNYTSNIKFDFMHIMHNIHHLLKCDIMHNMHNNYASSIKCIMS